MHWIYLAIAIVAEVIATTALKAAAGFTRPLPSLVVVTGYAIAFFCLSLTLRHVPIGIAYAIWSGVGIVLVSVAAWLLFGQRLDLPALLGIALIMAGVLVIKPVVEVGHALNRRRRTLPLPAPYRHPTNCKTNVSALKSAPEASTICKKCSTLITID